MTKNKNTDIKTLDDRQFREVTELVMENKFEDDETLIKMISKKFKIDKELSEKYLESIVSYLNSVY